MSATATALREILENNLHTVDGRIVFLKMAGMRESIPNICLHGTSREFAINVIRACQNGSGITIDALIDECNKLDK
jgi:hypothetical protein